jgi:hypothetical protein
MTGASDALTIDTARSAKWEGFEAAIRHVVRPHLQASGGAVNRLNRGQLPRSRRAASR